MIQLQNINSLRQNINNPQSKHHQAKSQNFGGFGELLTGGLQMCEQHPMLGVSAIDAATCIIPRAAVDFNTNAHAGLETLRRESSGLLVNCLLPSYFVMGVAGFLQYLALPKEYRKLGMVNSWADEDTINKLAFHYKKLDKMQVGRGERFPQNNVREYVSSVLGDLEGFNSSKKGNWYQYNTNKEKFYSAVDSLVDGITGKIAVKEAIDTAYVTLSGDSAATETVRFLSDKGLPFNSNLRSILRDTVDMGKKFTALAPGDIDNFSKSAINFVKLKSFAGLTLVLPLAASMQYINRWITRKKSGIEGAPIYRDFGSDSKNKKEKDSSLWAYKAAGASSIMGLALLSMMKKPNLKMFQFKGLFPTLDQARWIAAITFTSRVLAAEDRNEVRESTFRDIAGFASLYFLGDYVAKICATVMHKINPKVDLINKHKVLDKDAGLFKRFGNWVKNESLKSFDEVSGELKTKRAFCQAASLGASMLILGLFIPIWNRHQTEKNRAKELSKERAQNENNVEVNPYSEGPESTMSLLWHLWHNADKSHTFRGFEKITNFK